LAICGWNLVGSWVIEAGALELIGKYSQFSLEYFGKTTVFPKVMSSISL